MTNERRQSVEVHRVCSIPDGYCMHDTYLWVHSTDNYRTGNIGARSCLRLPHYLVMLEEEWQRGKSSDSIPVQENRCVGYIWVDGMYMGAVHRVQMVTAERGYPDRHSTHILAGAGE